MELPTEIKLKADALTPGIYKAMTHRKRFNFKWNYGPSEGHFTGLAEQTPEPGIIRVFDIEAE